MGKFSDDVVYGTTMEQLVCNELNKQTDWKVESIGGVNEPDFKWKGGYGEIKSYNDWYRQPMIEFSNCTTINKSLWVTDTMMNRLVVNHAEWLHIYDLDKLRYWCLEEGTSYHYKPVKQGSLDVWKTMKFIKIYQFSTLYDQSECHDDDPKRWDCSLVPEEYRPYIKSIRKDWSSIEEKDNVRK